jgi:hypothetical protein
VPLEQTEHRHLGGLAGRWNAQIRALLGPGMGQIGMGERVALISVSNTFTKSCPLVPIIHRCAPSARS